MRSVWIGAGVGLAAGLLLYVGRKTSTATPTPPQSQPPAELPRCPAAGTRVLLIGDSFAEGLAPQLKSLSAGCSIPYASDGRRGTHASQWQRDSWLGPALASVSPNVVLVSLGGNDFQNNPATLQVDIDTIAQKIKQAGARLLWIEPLKLPIEDTAGVQDMWRAAVAPGDWFDSSGIDVPRASDGIHTGAAGYKLWAERIWPWMNGRLAA